jgi:hypothetical protein
MKKIIQFLPLLLIIFIAFFLRLYKIDNPIADWHSFRQADTASVTREYVKNGINLLLPHYHDLSNIQSGKDNPEGFRMVEFPLLNGITAQTIRSLSFQSQEVLVGRLYSVIFSLITLTAIYFLGLKLSGKTTAIIAAGSFAVLPYSVYYSRVILPEPALLCLSTLSILLFLIFLEKKNPRFYFLTIFTLSLSLLIKPYAIFLFPVFLSLTIYQSPQDIKNYLATFSLAICLLPLLWWRQWITQYPTGIPASDWLYNQGNIRFKGAFFHWLFEVRLFTLILGITGLVPAILGLAKKGRDGLVYSVWLICLLAYSFIFAGGNIQHDYYQIIYLPLLCLLIGRGVVFLYSVPDALVSQKIITLTLLGLTTFSLVISWYYVRGYFSVNHWEIVEAGQAVDKLTPPNAKIIAPYNGDTAFLFQTNRTGWPLGFYVDEKIKQGASYYVSVNYDDEARSLEKKYNTVTKNDHFLLLNLNEPVFK